MDNKIIIAIAVLVIVVIAEIFISRMDTTIEPVEITTEEAEALAEEWVRNYSPTYTFDGSSLIVVSSEEVDGSIKVYLSFESNAAGYGDRSDEMVAQVITPHTTVVTIEGDEIVSVVTDETFDEMKEEMIQEMISANVYFVVVEEGQESIVSVEREVSAGAPAADALVLLLEGPTATELAEGYSTAIPEGVRVLGVDVQDRVVYVDFSSELEIDGGSAWVMMIRNQITETLTQFDWIDEVVIFIEGEEEVLQP